MNQETIERVCHMVHEVLRVYRLRSEGIQEGEDLTLPWNQAPAWVKQEVKQVVIAGLANRSSLSPDKIHAMWAYDKILRGWVYGPSWDLEAKTHPRLVSYQELDDISREKNRMVCAIIKGAWD